MRTTHAFASLLLALVACGDDSKLSRASAEIPAEAARLVPANAAAVLRVSSLDDLAAKMRRMARKVTGSDESGFEVAPVLARFGLTPDKFDLERPMLLAAEFATANPILTYVMPLQKPGDAPKSQIVPGHAVLGSYAAYRTAGPSKADEGAKQLVKALLDGDFAARVDVPVLLEKFQPQLKHLPQQLSALLRMGGVDRNTALAMRSVIDKLLVRLNAVSLIDLGVTIDGVVRVDLHITSSDAKKPVGGDVMRLARALEPSSHSVYMLGRTELVRAVAEFVTFEDFLARAFPEESQSHLREHLLRARTWFELWGDAMAAVFSFAENGALWMHSVTDVADAKAYVAAYDKLTRSTANEKLGVRVEPLDDIEISGVSLKRYATKIDSEKLAKATASAADLPDAQRFLEQLEKSDTQIAHGALGDLAINVVGPEAFQEKAVRATRAAKSKLPEPVAKLLGGRDDELLAMVYVDLRKMLSDVSRWAALKEMLNVPKGPAIPMALSVAADSGTWKVTLLIDFVGLAELGKEMRPR